jgi:hypothetical protein
MAHVLLHFNATSSKMDAKLRPSVSGGSMQDLRCFNLAQPEMAVEMS